MAEGRRQVMAEDEKSLGKNKAKTKPGKLASLLSSLSAVG